MGAFDLAAPLFDLVDAALAACLLPGAVRIVLYACVFAMLGMLVYRRFSRQERLAALRTEITAVRRELTGYDGDFGGLRVLIRRNTVLGLRQVGLTFWPALLASLPLLFVLPWLSNRFSDVEPAPATRFDVCVEPEAAATRLHWQPPASVAAHTGGCWTLHWPEAGATLQLHDAAGRSWLTLPTPAPTPIVHKRAWFNALFGNPGGYLDDDAPFDALAVHLPPRELLAFGPGWMRGWMFVFFVPLILVSLAIKLRWRVH